MSSAVQNILQRTLGDLARATKYEVFFAFTDPKVQLEKDALIAMGKTASFPGKTHTPIDLKYKGRSIPIKGQVKYTQTWDCTFYLTENHMLKNAFENWIEAIDQKHNYFDVNESPNIPGIQAKHNKDGYTTELFIYQKNFNDEDAMAEYTLHNAFPIEVAAVQTNYESLGQVQEITITFSYSHFTSQILKGQEGNFIDNLIGKLDLYATNLIGGGLSKIGDPINSFVSDAIGNSLSELNAWSAGLSTDLDINVSVDSLSDAKASQLMGAGPNTLPKTMQDVIKGQ
jgi:hypothetical protein